MLILRVHPFNVGKCKRAHMEPSSEPPGRAGASAVSKSKNMKVKKDCELWCKKDNKGQMMPLLKKSYQRNDDNVGFVSLKPVDRRQSAKIFRRRIPLTDLKRSQQIKAVKRLKYETTRSIKQI